MVKPPFVQGSVMATEKARVVFYISEEYKMLLGKLAAQHNRSVSNYMETLAIQAIEQARHREQAPTPQQQQGKAHEQQQ